METNGKPGKSPPAPTRRIFFLPWSSISTSNGDYANWNPAMTTEPVPKPQPRDPLHGITLEKILIQLVERHGWERMGHRIPIRCFQFDPTVKSSLTFLRKTPWARKKVENWFIEDFSGP